MRRTLLAMAAAVSLACPPAFAQDGSPAAIIDAAIGDWNRDGLADLAILAGTDTDEGTIGLHLFLRETDGELLKLALSVPDAAWGRSHAGGMYGQEPALEALPNGSLSLMEQNTGIGRERWEARRTIAWRDGAFVVAGFTFSSWDSLQEEEPLDCDLNLLTGKGTINDRAVTFEAGAIKIADWVDAGGENPGLSICRKP